LYSTSSRSSRTTRMYSLPCFQIWPWHSFMLSLYEPGAGAGDVIIMEGVNPLDFRIRRDDMRLLLFAAALGLG
jgi:hypothetical protein